MVGFSRNGFEVKGIDKRNECIKILPDFDIQECDLENENIPFGDNYFDCVYSKSVLEHIYNTEHIVKETYRVLKPGGITVQLTPDWTTDYKYFFDDQTHVKPFTKKGLKQAFALENFTEITCEYFYQIPFFWQYPNLIIFTKIISVLPDFLKWKDKGKTIQRVFIRHSKERMLLVSARKPR